MATETSGLRQGLLSGRKSVSPPAMSVAQHDPKAIATHGVVNSLQSPTPMKGKGKGKGKAGFVEAAPTSKKRLTYGPWSVLLRIMSCIYDDRWIHLFLFLHFSILSSSFFKKKVEMQTCVYSILRAQSLELCSDVVGIVCVFSNGGCSRLLHLLANPRLC